MFDFAGNFGAPWQKTVFLAASLVIAAVVMLGLYYGQAILVPLMLAVFLSLIVTPIASVLQKRGLGRVGSVIVVVTTLTLLLGAIFVFVSTEMMQIVDDLPSFSQNVQHKVAALREQLQNNNFQKLDSFFKDVTNVVEREQSAVSRHSEKSREVDVTPPLVEGQRQIVIHEQHSWTGYISELAGRVGETVGTIAIALILMMFMVISREDLRNRVIRVIGDGQLTVTTKALDEAGKRISRFLLTQAAINIGYGTILGGALWLIGLKYALLWGLLTALLRYIPFIGAWLAAIFPVAMAIVQYSTWTPLLGVVAVIVVMELVCNNVVEPILFGRSLGVSPVAFMIAVAFWAYLWGGIGLVMAGPLTVCLVVLGKYVPQLGFLNLLLGDEPVLNRNLSFYQRLVARDEDEALQIAEADVDANKGDVDAVLTDMIVPALVQTRMDLERGILTADDARYVHDSVRDIVDELTLDARLSGKANEVAIPEGSEHPHALNLVCIPGRDVVDRLILEMLGGRLAPAHWKVELTKPGVMLSELMDRFVKSPPEAVCLGSLRPGGMSHIRYQIKRLRQKFPEMKVFVLRVGPSDLERERDQVKAAGSDLFAESIPELLSQLRSWRPILEQQAVRHEERETGDRRKESVSGIATPR